MFPAGSLMNVTFIILSSSLPLTSVLRLMIFHVRYTGESIAKVYAKLKVSML